MARIAVIGLGRFGAHVAREAFHHGHEVLAIGIDPEAVQRMRDHATRAVVADARDITRLRALRLGQDFDAVVVSLGENVEASALIVLHPGVFWSLYAPGCAGPGAAAPPPAAAPGAAPGAAPPAPLPPAPVPPAPTPPVPCATATDAASMNPASVAREGILFIVVSVFEG